MLLDVTIRSITIKGVKTGKALAGNEMIGDSVDIDNPVILAYFLKPIKKETKIDAEAKEVYEQILGKLDLIQVKHVSIKNAEVHAINFIDHERQFDIINASINLYDVRIDSVHSEDTSRVLFCREASFQTDQFTSYNANRNELNVSNITFSGKEQRLSFYKLLLNRFNVDATEGVKLVEADEFLIDGINTFEIVKNKNILIDSIRCKHISFYRPPAVSDTPKPVINKRVEPDDTTGFRKAYSLELNNIYFPDIDVIENTPAFKNNYKLGKVVLKVNGIKADEIMQMQLKPFAHTREVDLSCNNISYNSTDNLYHYDLKNININSLRKQFRLGSFRVMPFLSEEAFARRAGVQKDRYEINFSGLTLNNMDFDRFLVKQIVANNLAVNSSTIKIYRDLSYPLPGISKVGNYPSQKLMKSDIPINIKHVSFNNNYLEYKEKNPVSGKPGAVKFERGQIKIDNMTNIPSAVKLNNIMMINFQTNVLGKLPMNTTLKFFLTATDGKFAASGTVGSSDAKVLNQVSMPMAMIKIDTGFIESIKFNLTGNDYGARGDFVMRYKDFKVGMFKKGEEDKKIKRKGLLSFLANTLIRNENPHEGELRTFAVEYDRDPYKSFFNLVWKAVFTGMKGTLGIPGEGDKIK